MPRLHPLAPLVLRRRLVGGRRLLARQPWLYWFAVGGLATATYTVIGAHTAARDTARDEWGTTAGVVVATDPLAPGDRLANRVAVQDWPAAIVPDDALAEVAVGAVARQHIGPGEPVTGLDLAAGDGALALVPAGWVAVPLVESPHSGAAIGDRVQVVSEGIVVAPTALVVGTVDPDVTLVAVPADAAALVPAAADAGKLTLLRLP